MSLEIFLSSLSLYFFVRLVLQVVNPFKSGGNKRSKKS